MRLWGPLIVAPSTLPSLPSSALRPEAPRPTISVVVAFNFLPLLAVAVVFLCGRSTPGIESGSGSGIVTVIVNETETQESLLRPIAAAKTIDRIGLEETVTSWPVIAPRETPERTGHGIVRHLRSAHVATLVNLCRRLLLGQWKLHPTMARRREVDWAVAVAEAIGIAAGVEVRLSVKESATCSTHAVGPERAGEIVNMTGAGRLDWISIAGTDMNDATHMIEAGKERPGRENTTSGNEIHHRAETVRETWALVPSHLRLACLCHSM